MFMPHYIALLAGACEVAGQVEEAKTLLDDALQIVDRTGERWFAAELNRHKGQLLLRQGHTKAAEELYRKALRIAQEQLWELRAAMSLARLRRDQAAAPKPATSSRRSTAGSLKASTRQTSRRRRRCSTSSKALELGPAYFLASV
jgi:predicted ATPase